MSESGASGVRVVAPVLRAVPVQAPDQVVAAAFDEAEARDPQQRRCWVFLVDGAAHQLELIHAEAARRDVTIHVALDIVHVIEKLWAASRCFYTATDPAAETWVGAKAVRILAGNAFGAVAGIRTEADRLGLSADQRGAADRACRYLENNAAYLHYDKALEAGWPIASGIVEGASRHLVADRLDITGSLWSIPGAEAVLTLRALISNGDFPQYWTFHTHRERERLYPQPEQHNYELHA